MPNWKKIIVSGSDASLNSLYAPSITGSLQGTASYAIYAETSSFSLAASANRILVINKSGATISKGTVVHLTGSNNSSDTPYITTASYESDNLSANTLGIASETITFNSTGYVTTEGVLTGLDVTGYESGQIVYLGATGSITGSAPHAPLHSVRLGQVVRDSPSNNGSIYVRIDNGYEIGELHDVTDNTTTTSYGDLLVKSGSIWVTSKQLTGSYGLTGSLQIAGSTSTDLVRITQTGTGNAFVVEDSTNPDTTPFVINQYGSVGIGTTTPSSSLTLHGSDRYITTAQTTYGWDNPTTIGVGIGTGNSGIIDFRRYTGTPATTNHGVATIEQELGANTGWGLAFKTDFTESNNRASSTRMFITNTGNVGIGTTTPSAKLHVSGTSYFSNNLELNINTKLWSLNASGYYINLANSSTNTLDINGFAGIRLFTGTSSEKMRIASNGNVGIGITTPSASLHVNNTSISASFLVEDETNPDSTPFVIDKDGLVGIGTTTPSSSLTLHGSDRYITTAQTAHGWGNTTTIGVGIGTGNSGIIDFRRYTGTPATTNHGVATIEQELGANTGWGLAFKTDFTESNNRASSTRMFITNTGNVGIGTTTPSAKLHVDGNTLITGSLTIGTSSIGANENTLVLGPAPAGGTGEGAQLLLQALGGTYTSASMIDNYQNKLRILRGTNQGSDAYKLQLDMHTGQMQLPNYNSGTAFSGTAAGYLAFDSSGNIITTVGVAAGAAGSDTEVQYNSAGALTGTSALRIVNSSVQMSGSVGVTGSLTATNSIIAQANGAMYFRGGDDAELWDINVANTVGIYGQQNSQQGAVKLGSGGVVLYGSGSKLGIGTTTPNSASLHVNGNVFATSFTGSLQGTASFATSASHAVSASFITGSNVFGPYGSNSVISSSYAETASFSLATTENRILVLNQSGYTISKGIVVHITGSNNSSDIPRIVSASYESDAYSANTLGIASQTITNGNTGYVTTEGVLTGIDTSAFTSGQLVYLGAAGSIIGTAPLAPLHAVRLGQIVREQSNVGSMYVRIDNGYELGELHDTIDTTTTASYGDLFIKSGSVWTNSRQLTGSYGITGSLIISGSGVNELQIGTDKLFVSASGDIGIGTTTPRSKMDISGSIYIASNMTSYSTRPTVGTASLQYGGIHSYSPTEGAKSDAGFLRISAGGEITASNKTFIDLSGYSNVSDMNQNIVFGTRDQERMRIDQDGDIGIGISAPTARLHITHTDAYDAFKVEDSTNPDASPFVIDKDGNVGIGTTTPTVPLDVFMTSSPSTGEILAQFKVSDDIGSSLKILNNTGTDGRFSPSIYSTGNHPQSAFILTANTLDDNGTVPVAIFDARKNGNTTVTTRPLFSFRNYATTIMQINANNNVGIGTASPGTKLHVVGDAMVDTAGTTSLRVNNTLINQTSGSGVTGIFLGDNGSGVNMIQREKVTVNTAGINLYAEYGYNVQSLVGKFQYNLAKLYTADIQRFYLDGNGNIGIGNNLSPTAKLHINNNTDAVASFLVEDDSNVDATPFIITNTGNVGIGTTTPNAKLDVNGNTIITGSLTVTNDFVLLGSASITYVSSSQLNINDNIITVNTYSPTYRFGGISVIDSGSGTPLQSGSMLFDSEQNQWIYIHKTPAGTAITSSLVIMGPQTYDAVGSEIHPTTNRIMKSVNDEHIGDSNITDTGTLVSINSNTEITGSLNISGSLQVGGIILGNGGIQLSGSSNINGDTAITGSLTVTGNLGGSGGSIDMNAMIQASLLYLSNNF